jgi:hypothetical protein
MGVIFLVWCRWHHLEEEPMRVSVPTDEITTAELRRIGASHADAYKTGAATLIAEDAKDIVFTDEHGWETIVTPINGVSTRFRARTMETEPSYAVYFTETMRWVMVARVLGLNDVILNERSAEALGERAGELVNQSDFWMKDADGLGVRISERLAELYVRDVRW